MLSAQQWVVVATIAIGGNIMFMLLADALTGYANARQAVRRNGKKVA